MKKSFLLSFCIFPIFSLAIVDTRSAGYSKTFVDFKANNSTHPLEIKRTYNSRSIYNGLYGFGWCSNIETQLRVLPDETIKVVECGGGMEILYHPKGKIPDTNLYVNRILAELKKRKIKMSEKNLNQLKKDLLTSKNLRANFLNTLNIRGTASKGLKYYAKGRSKEYIVVASSGYIRKLPNGFREVFNKEGRLVESSYNTNKVQLSWENNKIQIIDDRGNRLFLFLNPKGKVKQVRYNKSLIANYSYSGDNLAKSVNSSKKETHKHKYDSLNNLTKTTYPDGTTEELTYNIKKDWVVGFKDKRGCKESYLYGVNSKNSDHYFSTVEKICGRKIVNKSRYEFWHKNHQSPEGGKYLHRARAKINGRIQTDVTYHPIFGTPVSFFKNGVRTKREYYANGFLKQKDNIYQNIKYKKYDKKCFKPELVEIAYKNPNIQNKNKITKKETINFQFNSNCKLRLAKKSNDEWIRISHDKQGRIITMEDQSRKKINLAWNKKFNKPYKITREGVGSIYIVYNKDGNSVIQLKGLNKDPTVVGQVTSVFSSFLSALGPVAGEMVIL